MRAPAKSGYTRSAELLSCVGMPQAACGQPSCADGQVWRLGTLLSAACSAQRAGTKRSPPIKGRSFVASAFASFAAQPWPFEPSPWEL